MVSRSDSRAIVLGCLLGHRPTSRLALAEATAFTPGTVSRVIRELIDAGFVSEGETFGNGSRAGRKFVAIDFARNDVHVLGLAFEAYSQSLVLANLHGDIVSERTLHLPNVSDAQMCLGEIAIEVRSLLAEAGLTTDSVLGLGVAIVGVIDKTRGQVVRSVPLGWSSIDLATILESQLGVPVAVDNLLNAMVQAEAAFGGARGKKNVFLVRVSLATGLSIIAEGQLVRSTNPGQIGHLSVAGSRTPCICGRTGCLDAVASGRAILDAAGQGTARTSAGQAALLSKFLAKAAKDDRAAIRILKRAGRAMGSVLAPLVAGLQPQQIIFAGPVGRCDAFIDGANSSLKAALGPLPKPLEFHTSTLGAREAAVRLGLKELMAGRSDAVDRIVALSSVARRDAGEFATTSPRASVHSQ
jgi:predicted NBD/HSP70 family sugar kinase